MIEGVFYEEPDQDTAYDLYRQRRDDEAREQQVQPPCTYFKGESCPAGCCGRGHCLAAA